MNYKFKLFVDCLVTFGRTSLNNHWSTTLAPWLISNHSIMMISWRNRSWTSRIKFSNIETSTKTLSKQPPSELLPMRSLFLLGIINEKLANVRGNCNWAGDFNENIFMKGLVSRCLFRDLLPIHDGCENWGVPSNFFRLRVADDRWRVWGYQTKQYQDFD